MLTLHPVPGKAKSKMICEAFAAGAPRNAVGHVFFGVTDANLAAWNKVYKPRGGGEDFYYIDNSYFDKARDVQFRVTRNALQHRGLGASDCKRFDALGVNIEPWRKPKALRMLQVPQSTDFMCVIARSPSWLPDRITILKKELRGASVKDRAWDRNKKALVKTLQQDLDETDLLVTHSSAAAISAVLAGVCVSTSGSTPAYTYSVQMEHIVKAQAWGCLESLIPDRRQWAGVLADNQFTISEMKDGTAWSMLHPSTP